MTERKRKLQQKRLDRLNVDLLLLRKQWEEAIRGGILLSGASKVLS